MTVRQELKNYIDDIEEAKLLVLKPLLSALANDALIIETNLTKRERAVIAKGEKEYKEHPERFTNLHDIL
jgi:hypothetical protein